MTELKEKLTKLAFNRSIPFCYSCYKEAPRGTCRHCGSDDLMRLVSGVGCEWGTDWVIKHILETELEPVNIEESFEQMIRDCYPETTKVAWAEFDTATLLKDQDHVGWRCALADYVAQEESDGSIISFDNGSTYYWTHDIENLVEHEHLNKGLSSLDQ